MRHSDARHGHENRQRFRWPSFDGDPFESSSSLSTSASRKGSHAQACGDSALPDRGGRRIRRSGRVGSHGFVAFMAWRLVKDDEVAV